MYTATWVCLVCALNVSLFFNHAFHTTLPIHSRFTYKLAKPVSMHECQVSCVARFPVSLATHTGVPSMSTPAW